MGMQVILTQFTPAQAARITGVSPGLQRQWRSAGYFRAAAGEGAHARFTAPELAGLMAARALVDGGLNYKQAASHLPRLSDAIHYWVIDYPGAMGDGGEDEARLRARDSYLNKLGGDQESGPFYLVLPGGAGEFIWDLDPTASDLRRQPSRRGDDRLGRSRSRLSCRCRRLHRAHR